MSSFSLIGGGASLCTGRQQQQRIRLQRVRLAALIALVYMALSSFQEVHGWHGNWTILQRPDRSNMYDDCLLMEPYLSSSGRAAQHADTKKNFLRVYITTSDQILTMTGNLVESLLMAFPVFPSYSMVMQSQQVHEGASGTSSSAMDAPSMSRDSCRRWTLNGSLEYWNINFANHAGGFDSRRSHAQNNNNGGRSSSDEVRPPAFPFNGLCIGVRLLTPANRRAPTTPPGTPRDVVGNTAPFGSSSYYDFLEQKMKYFNQRIAEFSESPSVRSPWALLLDTDVQVFPGFFNVVAQKVVCPYLDLQCTHTNYQGGCSASTQRGGDGTVDVYYQRESRRLVNTGVALVNMKSSGVRCLYHEARLRLKKSQYGDQTAIQAVIRKRRGYCISKVLPRTDAPPPLRQVGGNSTIAPTNLYVLKHQVFHRMHVNGNVLNTSFMVAHHAHMAGDHKYHALRKAFEAMKRQTGHARIALHNGVSLHSGKFLRAESMQAYCGASQLSACPMDILRAPAFTMVCCVLQANHIHAATSLRSATPATARPRATWFTFGRKIKQLEEASAVDAPPALQPRSQRDDGMVDGNNNMVKRSLQPLDATSSPTSIVVERNNNNNSDRGGGGAECDGSDTNSSSSGCASSTKKGGKRFKKSKALWTALPAIIIIITLTIFHFFILHPSPPEDYSGVAPLPSNQTTPCSSPRQGGEDQNDGSTEMRRGIPSNRSASDKDLIAEAAAKVIPTGSLKRKPIRRSSPSAASVDVATHHGGFISLRTAVE